MNKLKFILFSVAIFVVLILIITGCKKQTNMLSATQASNYTKEKDYLLIDNCEDGDEYNFFGGIWYTNYDNYGDTIMYPKLTDKFYMTRGGSPESPGFCARVIGYIGPQAGGRNGLVDEGYYAFGGMTTNLCQRTNLKPFDATKFTGIRFWVRLKKVTKDTMTRMPFNGTTNTCVLWSTPPQVAQCVDPYPSDPYNSATRVKVLLRRTRTEGLIGAEFERVLDNTNISDWTKFLNGEWVLAKVKFTEFVQVTTKTENLRPQQPFDDLLAIYIYPFTEDPNQNILGKDINFDLSVDDIGLY